MGGKTNDWLTVVVTKEEHQVFTSAWRKAIPCGRSGTGSATRSQIENAVRQVYRDYPEILEALKLG